MTTRRTFLASVVNAAGFLTVASAVPMALTACSTDGDHPDGVAAAGLVSFPQGVASGDPRSSSVILWTRAIPTSGTGDVPLLLQLSLHEGFSGPMQTISVTALAKFDNTVRVKVTGLAPDQVYHYRFFNGSDISASGATKTLPAISSTRDVRFAWITCQDWSINHWAGLTLLAQESLDFVVHVGDYIYETTGAAFQAGQAEAAHPAITLPDGLPLIGGGHYANTLKDYRSLYQTYRSDKRLQTIHQQYPMIAIWDDHEFSDDCWQDHQTYTNENKQETERRRNATQAWAEYLPIDWTDLKFDVNATTGYTNISIYRDFRIGQHLHLVMTDERLYRDNHIVDEAAVAAAQGHDPINGSDSVGARYFVAQQVLGLFEQQKTAAMGRAPQILGTTQTQWFKDTLKATDATWKVWGNEVCLSRMWLDLRAAPGVPAAFQNRYVINCDSWDGYPTAKQELLTYILDQGIKNVVAVTGDLHAFQAGVVRNIAENGLGTPVLVDFVTAGISSSSFYSYLKAGSAGTPLAALVATPATLDGIIKANNPDFAYLDNDAQGYAIATVSATAMNVTFYKTNRINADGSVPGNVLLKKTHFTVAKDSTSIVVQDNV